MQIIETVANSNIYRISVGTGETWGHCAIWAHSPDVGPKLLVFGANKYGVNPILWMDQLAPQAAKLLFGEVKELTVYVVLLGVAELRRVFKFAWPVDGSDAGICVEPDFAWETFAEFVPREVLETWNWEPLDKVSTSEPLQIL